MHHASTRLLATSSLALGGTHLRVCSCCARRRRQFGRSTRGAASTAPTGKTRVFRPRRGVAAPHHRCGAMPGRMHRHWALGHQPVVAVGTLAAHLAVVAAQRAPVAAVDRMAATKDGPIWPTLAPRPSFVPRTGEPNADTAPTPLGAPPRGRTNAVVGVHPRRRCHRNGCSSGRMLVALLQRGSRRRLILGRKTSCSLDSFDVRDRPAISATVCDHPEVHQARWWSRINSPRIGHRGGPDHVGRGLRGARPRARPSDMDPLCCVRYKMRTRVGTPTALYSCGMDIMKTP